MDVCENKGSIAKHEQLVGNIIVSLQIYGRFWNQPTGVAFRDGQTIRYGLKGCADITGLWKCCGKRVEIECKTGRAKQSTQQLSFEKMMEKNNGDYRVCRSLADAIEFAENHKKECPHARINSVS